MANSASQARPFDLSLLTHEARSPFRCDVEAAVCPSNHQNNMCLWTLIAVKDCLLGKKQKKTDHRRHISRIVGHFLHAGPTRLRFHVQTLRSGLGDEGLSPPQTVYVVAINQVS